MDAFQTILKFFMNQKTAIGYSFMALLTMGGERVFSLVAFRCPCSNENFRYGLVFLFSPAFVLLVIGYFLNSKTWKLFTGCWSNPRKIFPRGNICHFFYIFGQITLNALVAPVMWLSVALLNGTFYECAMSGLKHPTYLHAVCQSKSAECFEELHKIACDKSSMPFSESDELKRTLQAQSQVRKINKEHYAAYTVTVIYLWKILMSDAKIKPLVSHKQSFGIMQPCKTQSIHLLVQFELRHTSWGSPLMAGSIRPDNLKFSS